MPTARTEARSPVGPKLADSHAHLSSKAFDADRGVVTAEALEALDIVVDVGCDRATSLASLALAHEHGRIVAAVGVHPHEARLYDDAALASLLSDCGAGLDPRIVALGEMGLDYHYDFSPRDHQRRVFAWQVDQARRLNMPVVVHIREAFDDAWAILSESTVPAGVLHCFTGTWAQAKAALDRGMYISFSGIVTFKTAQDLRDVARQVPPDRLLVETDCPYLTPHPHRGRRNCPPLVELVARCLAEVRGENLEDFAGRTTANTRTLFRVADGLLGATS